MMHIHPCAAETHLSVFLAQVERLQQRSLEKCARLQADIQATKTQKVLDSSLCALEYLLLP